LIEELHEVQNILIELINAYESRVVYLEENTCASGHVYLNAMINDMKCDKKTVSDVTTNLVDLHSRIAVDWRHYHNQVDGDDHNRVALEQALDKTNIFSNEGSE